MWELATFCIQPLTDVSDSVCLFDILRATVNISVGQVTKDDIPAASEPMNLSSFKLKECLDKFR